MRFGPKSFEQAVNLHFADLYRYAYWLRRDRGQAEDLVQDCLARAWRAWPGLREQRAVKSWLFTILYHEFARSPARKSTDTISDEDLLIEPVDHADPAHAVGFSRALRILSEESRHALLLQVLGGFSCAEIAALLGTTEGAMVMRLTRARQALRRTLEPGQTGKEARG